MARQLRLLDQAHIAAPCPANWDDMKGDGRMRHCSLCKLNVYNLSDMTDDEAERLLAGRSGRMCVRYYLRPDGKVMTKDCPRGLRALRQKLARRLALAASFVLANIGCGEQSDRIKEATGLNLISPTSNTSTTPVVMGKMPVLMGSIAPTPPPPSTGGSTKKSK